MKKMHLWFGASAIRICSIVAISSLLALACQSARATTFQVDVKNTQGDITSSQVIGTNSGTVTNNPDGTQRWTGDASQAGSYTMHWDLLLDPDPTVSGSVALTNAGPATQTFSLTVTLPVVGTPPAIGSRMFGSSAISVSDANGDTAATIGAPIAGAIYTAQVNGAAQRTLFANPYTKVVTGVPGGVAVDSQSFGAAPLEFTTVGAAASIGIQHNFTLTGGDSATMNSTFTVVPEPAALALAALGGFGLLVYGRRRHA